MRLFVLAIYKMSDDMSSIFLHFEKTFREPYQTKTKGESEYLSGRVQIGKDIEQGIYDLEIDGDTPCTIIFYESKSDMDTEDQISYEPPKEEELSKDRRVLRNYRLDKGNVLELNGNNIKFTKSK